MPNYRRLYGRAKICVDCGQSFPPTPEYFTKNGKYLNSRCRTCYRAYCRAYYQVHRDHMREQNRERNRCWRAEHPERARATWRRAYWRRREVSNEATKARNKRNRAQRRAYDRSRKPQNARKAAQRRRQLHNGPGVSAGDRQRIYEAQGGCCLYCGQPLDGDCTVDHFIPLSQGGEHAPGNIVLACRACNSSKGDQHPVEWEQWNGAVPMEW